MEYGALVLHKKESQVRIVFNREGGTSSCPCPNSSAS
jgi:hypothetical protein